MAEIPTPDAADNNTAATAESAGIPNGADSEVSEDQTFTKAEVDQMMASAIQQRLKQERRQQQKQATNADATEAEKLRLELEEQKSELARYRAKETFETRARELKFDNAAKIYSIWGHLLEFNDKGDPLNIDIVLKRAKEDLAELLRGNGNPTDRRGIDASARSNGPGTVAGAETMNTWIRGR